MSVTSFYRNIINEAIEPTQFDADGIATGLDVPFTLSLSAPAAPTISQPTAGAVVSVPQLNVAGTAMPGSQVQLLLNGQALGSPVAAAANGSFGAAITLPAEGAHQIEATASNARGTSPKSAPVAVTYTSAAPTVSFVAPSPSFAMQRLSSRNSALSAA